MIPWEPMLFRVPNWPSGRSVSGSTRPDKKIGVLVASIPSKYEGPIPLLRTVSP